MRRHGLHGGCAAATVLAVTALLSGCAGVQPAPSRTLTTSPQPGVGEPSGTIQASPSVEHQASPSAASPVSSVSVTFDPTLLGAPAPAPDVVGNDRKTAAGVTTEDIAFSRADVPSTAAYLVYPSHPRHGGGPGIIWFHWYEPGAPTSNRTEFLQEAQTLAAQGSVSLLVQGTFPWGAPPVSVAHDAAAVEAEVRMLRAGLDLLAARSDVDVHRIALVGHDFGAMYASVLFGADARVSGLVMMAPTARWGDWFLRYWSISDPSQEYLAAMAPLDPVTWLRQADGRPILLQLARGDQFVSSSVASEIGRAAGPSATTRTYASGHELNAPARVDRDVWLATQLGLQ